MARSRSARDLSTADRAVYDLVTRGGVDASHAALYRRQLGALARAGLVRRTDEGAFVASSAQPVTIAAPGGNAPANGIHPPAPPAEPPMVTVTCRVPAEVAQAIEELANSTPGTARADIIRAALARGLGSGVRKAVRSG
jgi:hypothetical protein